MELFRERILKVLFILIWILALLHMSAEYFYLYFLFKWFDLIPHFLGGVWVGLGGIWLWYFSGHFGDVRLPKRRALFVSVFFGIMIGFIWEFYEYLIRIFAASGFPANYMFDSILDLIMDIIGSIAGFFTFKYVTRDLSLHEDI